MTELRLRQWTAIGIGLLALLAYWPAVDNPFIADDYALLLGAEKAAEHCTALFAMPLGWRRLVSNFFFTVCYARFGPMAFLFYCTNLWLHVVNALLVFRLVRAVSGHWPAAVAAGPVFVAYEGHQEPVFWIGASHELLLAAGALATLLCFLRYRRTGGRLWYALALGAFVFSVFTKESFIILPPLLVLADWCGAEKRPERWWLPHAPFWLATAAYVALMYAGPWPYPFGETQSGLTLHFFGVYLRSLNRLLLFVYGFFGLGWIVSRLKKESFAPVLRQRPFFFFLAWLLVTIVPYSFILYERQLSSRHTYIPSGAAAALVGLLFAFVWERARPRGGRLAWAAVLAVCLAANIALIWKKDAEYLDRAAPTEQLIATLNREVSQAAQRGPYWGLSTSWRVVIYGFPYPPVVARGAARFFTPFAPEDLRFSRDGVEGSGGLLLRWNEKTKTFDVKYGYVLRVDPSECCAVTIR